MANLSDASGTMTIHAPNLAILFEILKNHRNEKQNSEFYTKYYTDLLEIKESMSDYDIWMFLVHHTKPATESTIELEFEAIGRWEYDNNIRHFVLQDLTKNLPKSMFVNLPVLKDQFLTGRFTYHDEEPGCGIDCDVITEYTYDLNTRVTKTKDLLYLTH
jgi:hypothetical protein